MSIPHVIDGVTDLDSELFNPIIDRVNGLQSGDIAIPLAGIAGALGEAGIADAGTRLDALENVTVFSPLNYSGTGDGVTDDVTPLQAAIDAAVAVGGVVDIGSKDWYVSDVLTAGGDFSLIGTGRILYDRANIALKVAPTWAVAHDITAFTTEVWPASYGLTCAKLTVAEYANYTQGDIVLIYSTDALPCGNDGGKKGELAVVAHVETGYVYLIGILNDTYSTSPKIRKHPMVRVTIDGPTFSATGDITVSTGSRGRAAVELQGCAHSFIRARFKDGWSRGLNLVSCFACEVDAVCQNLRDDLTYAAYGYGVTAMCASRLCSIKVQASHVRHAVTSNAYPPSSGSAFYGAPRDILVHDSLAIACTSNGFDTHPEAYSWVFESCHVVSQNEGDATSSGQKFAFQNRGANTTYLNCTHRGLGGYLVDASSGDDHGIESATLLDGCRAWTSDDEYASEDDQIFLHITGTANAANKQIIVRNCSTYNRDIVSTVAGGCKVTFDSCHLRNANLMRMGAGTTMVIRNTSRTWEITGSVEPILVRAGCTLELDGYKAVGTHANNSMIRGTDGPGTWTVKAAHVSSPTGTVGFKSDDGSGTWAVTDTAITPS